MTRSELLSLNDEELIKHCLIDFFKATGPGGQKKNKTESAVRLTLKDSSITASASEEMKRLFTRQKTLEMTASEALTFEKTDFSLQVK